MKILIPATILAAVAATGWAGPVQPARAGSITICIDPGSDSVAIRSAQGLASELFAGIGLRVDWRELRLCPVGLNAFQISLSYHTAEKDRPQALAYASPYEGSHIVVFYDRLQRSAPNLVSRMMAYVMVHEITHLLEGIARHSKSGIMKAQWDRDDWFAIARGRLGFAPEDVDLIYRGLDARVSGRAAAQLALARSNDAGVAAH